MLLYITAGSAGFARFEGLSGQALADAIREAYAPQSAFPDDVLHSAAWMEPYETTAALVPDEWWHDTTPYDLYNLIGASSAFVCVRYDYPPAPLDETTSSGIGWELGIGLGTNAWQPADCRRGDLARRMMYMALMYPQPLWHGRAVTVLEDGYWPLLSKAGAKAYLGWHRADRPDADELAEMADIAAAQGNANPFVEMPELAEYLWGDRAGMGYIPPETEKTRTPLRGRYSRKTDKEIDLYSPHVPEDARWTLDGKPVENSSVDLASITDGLHQLCFAADRLKGKLTISIEP